MKVPYTIFSNLSTKSPEIPPNSILSRTIYEDDQVNAVLFNFSPGQELSEHTASKTALLYFVEGEAQLTLGEDAHDAKPGTWVRMEPQLPHSIKALSPLVMLLVLIKT
jgi:quercetin dioxygenase-like cupin family protein